MYRGNVPSADTFKPRDRNFVRNPARDLAELFVTKKIRLPS